MPFISEEGSQRCNTVSTTMNANVWRKSFPGRGNSKCKRLKIRVHLVCVRNGKEEYKYTKDNVVENRVGRQRGTLSFVFIQVAMGAI